MLTMGAMFCHREITDPNVSAGGYFVIELKANRKDLFYNSADRLKIAKSYSVTVEDFQLDHGRIDRRACRVYHPEDLDVDPEKWSCVLRIIEVNVMSTDQKNRKETSDRRLYISNLDTDAATFGNIIRQHWSIESMHWQLDRNFKQDQIKRKRAAGARNLDTLQRIALSIIHIWKKLRRKKSDKAKGVTEILRMLRGNLTAIFRFLMQK